MSDPQCCCRGFIVLQVGPRPCRRVLLCVAVVNCNQATLFCDQWLCQFDCQYVVLPSAASLQTDGIYGRSEPSELKTSKIYVKMFIFITNAFSINNAVA